VLRFFQAAGEGFLLFHQVAGLKTRHRLKKGNDMDILIITIIICFTALLIASMYLNSQDKRIDALRSIEKIHLDAIEQEERIIDKKLELARMDMNRPKETEAPKAAGTIKGIYVDRNRNRVEIKR
jgi:hypothetical protein